MPDKFFEDPRSARVYDLVDGERDDFDLYESILAEFGSGSVLDIGSGTGALGARLGERGIRFHGIEPALGMYLVAEQREVASSVTFQHGTIDDVDSSPPFDAAVMTGNVAQVFLTDEEWLHVLTETQRRLAVDGLLVFETRDPAQQAWLGWTKERTTQRLEHPTEGPIEDWVDVRDVDPPFVTFDGVVRFLDDDHEIRSTSTLRFRTRHELDASLADAGFEVVDVRDAPDRPKLEWVYIARRVA